jgi:CRP-like cAMP-binding protein
VTTSELRQFPLFAGVSDAAIDRIRTCAGELEASPGQVLTLAAEPGSGMFVILDGRVTVELPGVVRNLGAGDFFGEIALLAPEARRTARVRAAEPVRLLAIPRDEALDLIESEPSLALVMLRELAHRFAAAE